MLSTDNTKRGSLLHPVDDSDKADWNHIIAALTIESGSDYPESESQAFQRFKLKKSKSTENVIWQKERSFKGRCQIAWSNSMKKEDLSTTNENQISRDMGNVANVLGNVKKFRELLKLKKILSEELFDKLREQFRIIDSNKTGYITKDKARRVNVLLSPNVSVIDIDDDVEQLFDHFDAEPISEMAWLRAWANSVKIRNYDLALVEKFCRSFDDMNKNTDLEAVLSSNYVDKFGMQTLSGVMKWKYRAKRAVKEQEALKQREEEARILRKIAKEERRKRLDSKRSSLHWKR